MSRILIIENALDKTEHRFVDSNDPLKSFLEVKKIHPQAKIYKGKPCPENDITPSLDNEESIKSLINANGELTIICYSGDVISAVTSVFTKVLGEVVTWLIDVPSPSVNQSETSGSSNNNLSNPENKQRIKQRVPRIVGRVKSVPDLYAPDYRHFVDGVEVEELLLCACENDVILSDFKEGDTPIEEISGKSVTAYGLNQDITGNEYIYKHGDTFDQPPVIAKKSNSINGQTLLPPNSTRIERSDIYFKYPNQIKTTANDAGFLGGFTVGDGLIIEGAAFGVLDVAITGTATIDPDTNTLSMPSPTLIDGFDDYRKINITAMLVTDPVNGQLDLAGLYTVANTTYSGGVYTFELLNPSATNVDFDNLTEEATTNISALLTDNEAGVNLDGEYSVTGVDTANKTITLASPAGVNPDWTKLQTLVNQQTANAAVKLRGSQENYIGWFTIDTPKATGLLFNFRAPNGIYQGSEARTVDITVQYQQVIGGIPYGTIYERTISMTGRGGNRDSVGASMWITALPSQGSYRFRARRTNDNGDKSDLMDETKFYQAYAFHYLDKLVYNNRVLVRTRTIATAGATSRDSRQLNCIAQSLVYSYRGGVQSASKIPSRNIADLTIDLALDPKIGRREISDIDVERIYQTVDDIVEYFGSERMAEFNYTIDDANMSFEEIMRMMAAATATHDRRVIRKIYYDLESADNLPIVLFNHRNKRIKTEVREYTFRNQYDGIELTYVDSTDGWIEKTLRVPNNTIIKPKKVEGKGIVYPEQAHIIAWRHWNKAQFSRVYSTFNAYGESDLVFKGDFVLNTDDTRIDSTSSGEILTWDGLSISVSQPFNMIDGEEYYIHLQMKDRSIDVMRVTHGQSPYDFILERAPREALVVDGQLKSVYSITTQSKGESQRFLVMSKTPTELLENELTLTNLDDRFYRNDKDIINNII